MLPLERALVVTADDELRDAYSKLLADPLHRALVLDDGRLAGLLSLTDVTRVLEAGSEQLTGRAHA